MAKRRSACPSASQVHDLQEFIIPVSLDATRAKMNYLESYYFVFRSKDWALNLVLGFLCFLIVQFMQVMGLVAAIVYWGYQISVVESLIRYPQAAYPTFDFQRFAEYLHRAIWPFLITLPLWLLWMMQLAIAYFGTIISAVILGQPAEVEVTGAIISIGIPTAIFLYFLFWYFAWLILTPITLRAGLTRSFREGFRLRWLGGFIKRTWLESSLAFAFLLTTSTLLWAFGLAFVCIGVFAAQAWALLAQGHLSYQLYQLYLQRGGQPIEIYVPPPPAYPYWQPAVADTGEDIPVGTIMADDQMATPAKESYAGEDQSGFLTQTESAHLSTEDTQPPANENRGESMG